MAGEHTLNVDKEGFLRHLDDWCCPVAEALAAQDDIVLSPAHWEVINLVRAYYDQYAISPVMRVLVRIVKQDLGPEKGNSLYLMSLFKGRPARYVSKIAGLPKPTNCD